MNLFNQYLIDSARSAMDDVFDSFKRTNKIRVYKSASEVYLEDPYFNLDFKKSVHSEFLTQTPQYEEFEARIVFLDNQPSEKFIGGGGELAVKASQNYGRMRIQVREPGYLALKDCKSVIFQGEKFVQEADVRKVGVLNEIQFYSFIFKKIT